MTVWANQVYMIVLYPQAVNKLKSETYLTFDEQVCCRFHFNKWNVYLKNADFLIIMG